MTIMFHHRAHRVFAPAALAALAGATLWPALPVRAHGAPAPLPASARTAAGEAPIFRPAFAAGARPSTGDSALDALRDAALKDEVAIDLAERLTTEVGPRLAGSPEEARARAWAVAELKRLGFANVQVEPFSVPYWVRGEERAAVITPFPHKLMVTALGNSAATPAEGLTAQVVAFENLDALKAADPAKVRGHIVFVDHRMAATQDGSSYGDAGQVRRVAPSIAAGKGAAAILIRSVGTDRSRWPHTGTQQWQEGVAPIPAAALSVVDAELLNRMLARGKEVQIALTLTPRLLGTAQSGNVIAELPGTDPQAGMIIIGGHLDSWDLGTGAMDDAAGLAITTAAAKHIMAGPRPERTIRLVWFGAEEIGIRGGQAYAEAHKQDPIAFVAESDFGADRIWQVRFNLPETSAPAMDRTARALATLGIARGSDSANGGPDVRPLVTAGHGAVDLLQDGSRYFDLHHTAEDTFDKIDPAQIRQNVAAWALMLRVLADSPELSEKILAK